MVATSDTPGNGNDLDVGAEVSATPGPAAERKAASSRPLPSSAPKNATAPTCVDVPAPGEFSCAQQKVSCRALSVECWAAAAPLPALCALGAATRRILVMDAPPLPLQDFGKCQSEFMVKGG